jgi:hypothetical protein
VTRRTFRPAVEAWRIVLAAVFFGLYCWLRSRFDR